MIEFDCILLPVDLSPWRRDSTRGLLGLVAVTSTSRVTETRRRRFLIYDPRGSERFSF